MIQIRGSLKKNTKSNQNQEDSDSTVQPNPVFAKFVEKEFLRNKNGNQAVPKTVDQHWGGDHDGGIQEIGGLIDKLAEEGDEKAETFGFSKERANPSLAAEEICSVEI